MSLPVFFRKRERELELDTLMALVTKITNLLGKNYIARVRSLQVPFRPQVVSTCLSPKKDVDQRIKQAEEIKAKLQQQKEELFEPSSTRLKSWAKEQFAYIQEMISTTIGLKGQLGAVREDIQQIHEKLAKRHMCFMHETHFTNVPLNKQMYKVIESQTF